MAQNADEKRGYQRGYNRAGKRSWDRVRAVLKVAKGYRDRSKCPNEDSRLCATCSRWARGKDSHSAGFAAAQWGECAASFEYDLEGRMWADTFPHETHRHRAIITSQDFGCVNWTPRT